MKSNSHCDGNGNLRRISSLIRGGFVEEILMLFLTVILDGKGQEFLTKENLVDKVKADLPELREDVADAAETRSHFKHYLGMLRELHRRTEPIAADEAEVNFSLLSIYARLGLKDQVLQMLENQPGIAAEEKAAACEFLEVAVFDGFVNLRLRKTCGLPPRHKLEYFRMAQRIRDAHGISRGPTAGKCFASSKDIDMMEEQIEAGCATEFLVQSCLLSLVDIRHFSQMFTSLSTHSQLTEFYARVSPVHATLSPAMDGFDGFFSRRFEMLACSTPTWHESLLYLKVACHMNWYARHIRVDVVPQDALDVFLNYLLLYWCRCMHDGNWTSREGSHSMISPFPDLEVLFEHLISFLERGASLNFTADQRKESNLALASRFPHIPPDELLASQKRTEWSSSMALLLQFAIRMPEPNRSKFTRYVCCPLNFESGLVRFDEFNPPRLTCLAARHCAAQEERLKEKDFKIPKLIISWIQVHRELRAILENGQGHRTTSQDAFASVYAEWFQSSVRVYREPNSEQS